ncbi:MAG: hypothetical protein DRG69_04520 [Deltaproteobacteria bacterium]|nr:MAG: hypothetical protein DRG69_04520 [Deltaproteobacteria bacterium]
MQGRPFPMNVEKAMKMVGGDKELLKELLELFLSDYPAKVSQIREAMERRDKKTLQEVAHALKGACANLALEGVYELSLKMEKEAKEGNWEVIEELYKELVEELGEIEKKVNPSTL